MDRGEDGADIAFVIIVFRIVAGIVVIGVQITSARGPAVAGLFVEAQASLCRQRKRLVGPPMHEVGAKLDRQRRPRRTNRIDAATDAVTRLYQRDGSPSADKRRGGG